MRRCRFLRRRRRKRQRRHEDLRGRPVLGDDVPIAADIQIAGVSFPGREEDADLRADADRVALEVAEFRGSSRRKIR